MILLGAIKQFLTSLFSALSSALASKTGRWMLGSLAAILLLFFAWGRVLSILRDRDQIKAERDKIEIMYTNQAKEYETLKTEFKKMQVREYRTEHILPSGERIIYVTRYVDSERGSTERDAGKTQPKFPPTLAEIGPVSLPVSALGIVNQDFWTVGLGYEAVTVKLPLVPYTIHGTAGVALGQEWSSGKLVWSIPIVLRFSKKQVAR